MATVVSSPLIGIETRSADNTNAGFEFQHWLAVLAWLELGSEDLLVIEGVEDIDVISRGTSTLTQAKRRSSDLKLSTKEAAIPVGNYLIAATKNGDVDVRYVYVTTASAGEEPNSGFRTETRGVHIWSMCAKTPSLSEDLMHDLEQLPRILSRSVSRRKRRLSERSTPGQADEESIANNEAMAFEYLENAIDGITAPDFLEQIVRPITWNVSHPDTQEIEELVTGQLTALSNTWQVRPAVLGECRFRLLRRVMRAASGANGGKLVRSELEAEIKYFLEVLGFSHSLDQSGEPR